MKVMSVEEARYIIRWLDPGPLARKVWQAAGDDGYAVGALALATRRVVIVSWPAAEQPPPIDEPLVVLVSCEPGRHSAMRESLSEGMEVGFSDEVIEEAMVEEARKGISYERIEERLRDIYAKNQATHQPKGKGDE